DVLLPLRAVAVDVFEDEDARALHVTGACFAPADGDVVVTIAVEVAGIDGVALLELVGEDDAFGRHFAGLRSSLEIDDGLVAVHWFNCSEELDASFQASRLDLSSPRLVGLRSLGACGQFERRYFALLWRNVKQTFLAGGQCSR